MAKTKNNETKPKDKTQGVSQVSKQIVKSPNEVQSVKTPDPEKIAKKKAKKLKQQLKKQEERKAKAEKTSKKNAKKLRLQLRKQAEQPEGTTVADGNTPQPKNPQNVKLNTAEANDKTIFVGNLPVNTKRVQLLRLFQECGKVLFIRFRTGNGKNIYKNKARKEAGALIAYVVLDTPEGARKALDLNGAVFKGNHLRITRADKKTTQASEDIEAKRTIFVGNLKYSCTEESLHDIFTSCGEIEYVRCLRDDKGCKGVAYVLFKSADSVGLALELNGSHLEDRPIHVERYSVKKLGAKQARDDAIAKEGKPKKTKHLTGAPKRLDIKNRKAQKNLNSKDTSNEKKKSEFRGVKVDGIKKKKNKKKSNSEMKQLAKKIAPKA